ncbi:cytochrome c biogenesis CcdA family protein [Salininema proteolyticum]|uniref:Cytochrome c biogenesis CcdA family protein n=1 Tax=Salininema proteolyticum TaxID=1607685 RepID=A0ABV8TWB2_9ACTN
MGDIGFAAAFVGGVLALLSPCSALLVPSFFGYAFTSSRKLLGRTVVFYLGLCLTLVPLGAGAAAVSRLFYGHRGLLIAIAGWTLITLGVLQIAGKGFAPGFAQRLQARFGGRTGGASVFALGSVYGFAGFCSGPILGAVLTLAATGSSARGGALLAVYALGMALPLFVLAALWDRFDLGSRGWLRGRNLSLGRFHVHSNSLISGLMFIAIGVLFLVFDGTASLFNGEGFTKFSFQVQQWVGALGADDADIVLLGTAGVALTAWGLYRWKKGGGEVEEIEEDEPVSSSEGR